jgi:hypothetical protein
LQDHDRALIIGQPTYGKGVVQTAYRVGGGSILKITTGEWHTPSGRSIHRKREKQGDRWVVVPDDSAGKAESFKSDAGRKLAGHGGIEPDVRVANDTLKSGERAFIEAVRPQSTDFYIVYTTYAAELKSQVKPGFTSGMMSCSSDCRLAASRSTAASTMRPATTSVTCWPSVLRVRRLVTAKRSVSS